MIPLDVIQHKILFKMLFETKPTYTHLRVFGCLAFVSTLSNNTHKFDTRAKKFGFLKYPFGVKNINWWI